MQSGVKRDWRKRKRENAAERERNELRRHGNREAEARLHEKVSEPD